MIKENNPLMRVENLSKYFKIKEGQILKAVDDASFDIYKGETIGLVGESGCGKSTTGRCLVKLEKPTKGEVYFEDKEIYKHKYHKDYISHHEDEHIQEINPDQAKLDYTKNVQMIFQNPYSSLNPRMTVKDIVGEGIRLHNKKIKNKELEERIEYLLRDVGLSKDHISRFPHEFSGGQRQRIGIARALSVDPKFIVCDEPISALDVSVQAQVINMLKKIQKERELTYLFIAHDLSVVKYISDKVIVMYLGNIVEKANSEDLYKNPMHPYTQALLSSIPVANPKIAKKRKRIVLEGELSSPINPKEQCRFADRCKHVMPLCREVKPQLKAYEEGHEVACHLYK